MENYVNIVVMQGGVVKDPELVYNSDGLGSCKFSIACSTIGYKNGEKNQDVNYFDIISWGKLAEICSTYLKKGRRVIVSGKLKQSRWKSEEGKTRSRIQIVAQDVKFLPSSAPREQEGGTEKARTRF